MERGGYTAPPIMRTELSHKLFAHARARIPGGVNSPVRAFRAVGGDPRFIARASGARLVDVDGNEYVDLLSSWGPMIVGHAHPNVVSAIHEAARRGTSYGAPSPGEVRLADLVVERMPWIERVRMVSSGTEACMSALRLARAATGRPMVLKFEGCYHGHADGLLVKAGSGATTLGVPDSPGVTPAQAAETLTARYNDLDSVRALLDAHPGQVAAIIVEPVAGNMGLVPPVEGFLTGLRALADRSGALLIFDEVITGFRVAPGGAQQRFGVRPDLTTLGKILGGGLPVGAYGGRAELMDRISPAGPVYQAGTLSGNPLAMAAGIATLELLADTKVYELLESRGARLAEGLATAAQDAGVTVTINRVASLLTVFFQAGPVTDYASALRSDVSRFGIFFRAMLEGGVYLPPSQFEAAMVSTALTEADVERVVDVARRAFSQVSEAG